MDDPFELERLQARGPIVAHLRELALIFFRASEEERPHREAFWVAAEHLRAAVDALTAWADEAEQ